MQTYDSSLFVGQSYYSSDEAQLYLIFQPLHYAFKRPGNAKKDASWKSKGLSSKKLPLLIIVFIPQLNGNSLKQKIQLLFLQI